MGPLRLIDEIGVDVTVDIARTLEKAYGGRDHAPEILLKMQTAKMLGRKTGSGFYKYEGKQQTPSDALAQWRRSDVSSLTSKQSGEDAASTLPNRLIFLMVNEAARCLEEEVIDSAEDADYGMILGTGFAPFRGGPLRFADHYGLEKVVAELEEMARTEEKFAPAEILRNHVRNGTTFYRD
jgi:3-hydroxyacyl-CoA dehydrogenase/enoyl-CoA hydratase/3-hydroxybutyryl-CoA epimerase